MNLLDLRQLLIQVMAKEEIQQNIVHSKFSVINFDFGKAYIKEKL